MDADSPSKDTKKDNSEPDLGRRGFVGKAGKALYLTPTLALLGSVEATAQRPWSGDGAPPCVPWPHCQDDLAPDAPEAPPPPE